MSQETRWIKLLTVVDMEIEPGMVNPLLECRKRLDKMRESVLPSQNYGIMISIANALDIQQIINEGKTVDGFSPHAIVNEAGVVSDAS